MALVKQELSQIISISSKKGEIVRIRGFLSQFRSKRKIIFLVIREGLHTVQCIAENSNIITNSDNTAEKNFENKNIPIESYVEVVGKVVEGDIKSCTITDCEIQIMKLKILSESQQLPFSLRDSAEEESQKVSLAVCLDNRALHLRTPHMHSIIKILNGVMFSFRDLLRKEGFVEITTPKLIESASEGGANVFEVKFFKRNAYLAQSPQLYKQMAIIGGLKRVYEIGHVYRAEESKINRYLSEFTGLDLEMEIDESYEEVFLFIYKLLTGIFNSIKADYSEEIEVIRKFRHFEDLKYPESPIILTHKQCIDLLVQNNIDIGEFDDFSRENERFLGELVLKKYNTDIFIIKDYPSEVRAFYTKKKSGSPYSYSYDFIIRGEEILSGARREDEYEQLMKTLKEKNIDHLKLKGYLESFKYGVPPHGGCGIGFERLMKAYFGFFDIRFFNIFPRDPNRLYP
ncbi:putative aspartate--tRNA ligase, cytoplasmic [Dictyocoela muelleri]|nr:putative aspartate--tRNA ligase, cytoplasmic [Dictyocoela muelleri]